MLTTPPPLQLNVIPALAEAYINMRIHPAQSLQEVESNMSFFSTENPWRLHEIIWED